MSAIASSRVAVVRNADSPISCALADDYAARRSISNVITVRCRDAAVIDDESLIERAGSLRQVLEDAGFNTSPLALWPDIARSAETTDFATYLRCIEGPIIDYLADRPEIDVLVVTKGIPLRVAGVPAGPGVMRHSVDSRLAATGYEDIPGSTRIAVRDPTIPMFFGAGPAQAWVNRFWNSDVRFTHREFGGYLVSRLDGFTLDDALALTTRALEAESAIGSTPQLGRVLLDPAPRFGAGEGLEPRDGVRPSMAEVSRGVAIEGESPVAEFNADLRAAAGILRSRGIPVVFDDAASAGYPGDALMGLASFASNDPDFDEVAFGSLRFAPGAIAETAVSTSARSFLEIRRSGGQSLIAELVRQGVSVVKGYTDEPLLQAVASPAVLFERYTRGWTAVESMYAASALVGWQDVVVGDPLCRAYPEPSHVTG